MRLIDAKSVPALNSSSDANAMKQATPLFSWLFIGAAVSMFGAAAAVAQPASAPAACATAGFVVALQGIGGSTEPFAAPWTQAMQAGGGSFLVDESPQRVYEGPQTWGRVTVVRWRCFEDAKAVWQTLAAPAEPAAPAPPLHTAALYRGGNYPEFPESMRKLPLNCTAPCFLMAVNSMLDAAKYAPYRNAMMKTEYVQQLGSTTLFTGAPAARLGNWPDNLAASMTRWPCARAFEAFYFDKTYVEQIKPLRTDAIDYRILGFANADKPRQP
jgi:uncharacterized protein (DUF1330 family)